jgi:hypothetical protein
VSQRHSDDLFRFSYRIFKLKFIIIEIVFFALSMYGLYKLVKEEVGHDEPSRQAAACIVPQTAKSP